MMTQSSGLRRIQGHVNVKIKAQSWHWDADDLKFLLLREMRNETSRPRTWTRRYHKFPPLREALGD